MPYSFYIACNVPAARAGGIQHLSLHEQTVTSLERTPCEAPGYLALNSTRTCAYAACAWQGNGGPAAFRMLPDGTLAPLNHRWESHGALCHLAVLPGDRLLAAANYHAGRIEVFPLDEAGEVGQRLQFIQHTGHGPNAARQESAHVHFVQVTPDRRYLLAIDLGLDAVFCYPITTEGLDATAAIRSPIAPAGTGPRHLVFAADGRHAWLLNELSSTVTTLDYADGRFTQRQTCPMVPQSFTGNTKAAAIRLSPDGRFLYASNRGYDTIVLYRVQPDFTLQEIGSFFTGAAFLRDFNFIGGSWTLAVAGETSNDVFFFDVNPETGFPQPNGLVLCDLPQPINVFCG
ncbi:MAG: lactonase family protein [Victivallales bacterium]|nr:lactonase family protein [Victivallales bacterium]